MARTPSGFTPSEHLEEFGLLLERSAAQGFIAIVCDTNVYLDARETIGVEADGTLRIAYGPAKKSPAVAVLRASSVAGVQTRFTLCVVVTNELFHLIRGGYSERPQGLGDARQTAAVVRNLLGIQPLGHVFRGGRTVEASLPDPPLSAAEKNDRHIWYQARADGAILVTADSRLIEAVRIQTGNVLSALRPVEFIDMATAYVEATSGP